MEYAAALLILAVLVAAVVIGPLRRPGVEERAEQGRIEDLQAAKEAKYREIRDAELDREMGKLSRDDWRTVDRDLRGEAIEILRELDRLEGRRPGKAARCEGKAPRGSGGAGPGHDAWTASTRSGRGQDARKIKSSAGGSRSRRRSARTRRSSG